MKTSVAVLAAALALAAGVAPSHAAPDFQVVRLGDNEATCEALITEINALHAEVQRQQQQAQRNAQARQTAGRLGRGLLSGLARSASTLAYGGSTDNLGTSLAANAASGVASEIASGGTGGQAEAPAPAAEVASPQKQRLDHLQAIASVRPC